MQRQQSGNGIGGGTTVNGGGSEGVNNAGGNTVGTGSNGSTGSGGRGSFNGGSSTYQNANAVQAASAWAFQLLPSLYNHYQKVLENPARIAATNRLPP